jgi:hypothetical protein
MRISLQDDAALTWPSCEDYSAPSLMPSKQRVAAGGVVQQRVRARPHDSKVRHRVAPRATIDTVSGREAFQSMGFSPRRRHPHAHFARSGVRLRDIAHLKNFRSPELLLDHRSAHGYPKHCQRLSYSLQDTLFLAAPVARESSSPRPPATSGTPGRHR